MYFQVVSSLSTPAADPNGDWKACRNNPGNCSPSQINFFQGIFSIMPLSSTFSHTHTHTRTLECDSLTISIHAVLFWTDFRNQMLNALKEFSISKENGLFVNSCFAHCQTERQDTWFADDSPVINNKVCPSLFVLFTTCLVDK